MYKKVIVIFTLDAPLNVSYLANYNGTEGRLVEIVLVWIENLVRK